MVLKYVLKVDDFCPVGAVVILSCGRIAGTRIRRLIEHFWFTARWPLFS